MLKVGDYLLIGCLIILSLCYFVYQYNNRQTSDENLTAVISQNNKVIKSINLKNSKTEIIKLKDSFHIDILVEDNKIKFLHADCKDKLCIGAGWLSKAGDTSICLPSKTIIKIVGTTSEVDGVAH